MIVLKQLKQKNIQMSLFHHISFNQVDPLGDGLREEIQQEQTEQESITLEDGVDEGQLSQFWQSVEADIQEDPEWFHFSEDE
jgi:hypothetical protein